MENQSQISETIKYRGIFKDMKENKYKHHIHANLYSNCLAEI